MPHIQIIGWTIHNDEIAGKLLERVTLAVQETLLCPLDKISVCIQETSPSRWADAGVVGSDPDFVTKSRRKQYGEMPDGAQS